jgi:cell wall assembly regulator SMI1
MSATFSYRDWVRDLKEFVTARTGVSGFVGTEEIAPPLTAEHLSQIDKQLPLALPGAVRDFLQQGSGACRFGYKWKPKGAVGEHMESVGLKEGRISGGATLCHAARLGKQIGECKQWAEETWIADEEEEQEVWLNTLPIAELKNGDYLGVQLGSEPNPPVVYLCHEDASQIIAPSFTSFLQNWAGLCYLGPEIWILEPFLDSATGFLDGQSERALAVRRLFSLT